MDGYVLGHDRARTPPVHTAASPPTPAATATGSRTRGSPGGAGRVCPRAVPAHRPPGRLCPDPTRPPVRPVRRVPRWTPQLITPDQARRHRGGLPGEPAGTTQKRTRALEAAMQRP